MEVTFGLLRIVRESRNAATSCLCYCSESVCSVSRLPSSSVSCSVAWGHVIAPISATMIEYKYSVIHLHPELRSAHNKYSSIASASTISALLAILIFFAYLQLPQKSSKSQKVNLSITSWAPFQKYSLSISLLSVVGRPLSPSIPWINL
jgi:hypothetical protein